VEGGVHILGGSVHGCTMLQQQHDDVDIAQPRCNVKWRLLLLQDNVMLSLTSNRILFAKRLGESMKAIKQFRKSSASIVNSLRHKNDIVYAYYKFLDFLTTRKVSIELLRKEELIEIENETIGVRIFDI